MPWRELERHLSWRKPRDGGPPEQGSAGPPRAGRAAPAPAAPLAPAAAVAPWAELHCHSSYSFLDGASSPAELVAEAARRGLTALAITDHDGMYGVPQFAQAVQRFRDD